MKAEKRISIINSKKSIDEVAEIPPLRSKIINNLAHWPQ